MIEYPKELQDRDDKEDRERIMRMNPRDMRLTEFLVYKRVLLCTDLSREWNLNISRDCYVASVKNVVEAMNEWAALKSNEAIFHYQCGQTG